MLLLPKFKVAYPFDRTYKNCFENVFLPINVPRIETFTESQTVKIYRVTLTNK